VSDNPHDITKQEFDEDLSAPISEGIEEMLAAVDITIEPAERIVLADANC